MKVNSLLITVLITIIPITTYSIDDIFGKVKEIAEEKYMNPFAKDLSALLNPNGFHDAESLKLLGFDIGLRVTATKLSHENVIISTATKMEYILLPTLFAEAGLPTNFNLILKGLIFYNAQFIGIGIKYSLPKAFMLVSISAVGFYNVLSHKNFNVNTYNLNIVASVDTPIVRPFLGIGYENAEVEVLLNGLKLKGKFSGPRVEGGINFSPFPLTYFYIGAGLSGEKIIYNLGLGTKFGGII